jgi:hypothetical protein
MPAGSQKNKKTSTQTYLPLNQPSAQAICQFSIHPYDPDDHAGRRRRANVEFFPATVESSTKHR